VYVEFDMVNSILKVLLFEIAESAAVNSGSQQCNLEESPFLYRLHIQTDGAGTLKRAEFQFRGLLFSQSVSSVSTKPPIPFH
jgi:hypothetical protein